MTDADPSDPTRADSTLDSLADPASLRDRDDVQFSQKRREREDRDHCGVDGAGEVIVGVSRPRREARRTGSDGVANDDGEHLLLVNDDLSIALLPHGSVDPGEDWAAVAREEAEGQTGIEIELDGIEAVREVGNVVEGEDEPHATTHQIVFRGSPAGGEIQDCKRSAEAGSDGWRAGWFDGLPEGVDAPDGTPGEDLRLFVE